MDRWKEKVALVIEVNAGIGKAIVKAMAKYDMRIIVIATRLEKLQELARNIKYEYNTDIYPMKCDLRQAEEIFKVLK
jgi:short-subunit dehydrogenase